MPTTTKQPPSVRNVARHLFILIFLLAACVGLMGQSPPCTPVGEARVSIAFPHSELGDIVKLYRTLSKRKTWIDAELRFDRKIDLPSRSKISVAEALDLIRDALRKDGIEIREVGDSEAYVSKVAE